MPIMTMTVKYVNPPKAGKQRGSIKGTDDVSTVVRGQIASILAHPPRPAAGSHS
jgi:hypothetical protein